MAQKHILHIFATFNVGGTEVRTCNIINHFQNEFRHTIRVLKSGTAARSFLTGTADVSFNNTEFPIGVIAAIRTAQKEIKELKPDLIITYTWGAIEWLIANALSRYAPHIHAEDGFTDEAPDTQNPKRLLFRRLFFRFADTVIVPAKVLEDVAKKYWWLPSRKITMIPNSVNIDRFTPAKRDDSRHSKVILGIIGTLYPVKNHKRLFDAFAKISTKDICELWVIGSGPDEHELKEYVKNSGLNDQIRFLGIRTDTEQLLQKVDIFCLSSDHEQMPLTILEAMASGLPVVSTDVGDIQQMVASENKKFIVPLQKIDLYIDALNQFIENPFLRKCVGMANRMHCEKYYSQETMYQSYRQLIQSIIKR
jgi:glycosyltransferase involved in cell wall biosynthesis